MLIDAVAELVGCHADLLAHLRSGRNLCFQQLFPKEQKMSNKVNSGKEYTGCVAQTYVIFPKSPKAQHELSLSETLRAAVLDARDAAPRRDLPGSGKIKITRADRVDHIHLIGERKTCIAGRISLN